MKNTLLAIVLAVVAVLVGCSNDSKLAADRAALDATSARINSDLDSQLKCQKLVNEWVNGGTSRKVINAKLDALGYTADCKIK